MRMRVVVLSDTHLHRGSRRLLPEAAYRTLDGADAVLHAGDVVDEALLQVLATVAPTHAVLGNNDHGLVGVLPGRLELDLGGVAVALVHDSGSRIGRPARMRRRFPRADVVVFGHSHIPVDEAGDGGQWLFNPGSPTQRRGQPHHTVGVLDIDDGRVVGHRIVVVDPP